jgi:putative oxidoreductase
MKLLATLLRRLTQPTLLPHWGQDFLLLLPRVLAGYWLTADFGAAKFGMPWSPPDNNLGLFEVAFWFPSDVAAYGGVFAQFPALLAWLGAFSEAVGGLLLLLGLQTRLSALLIACTMLVAIFMQQLPQGLWNALPAIGFLWAVLPALVLGSGRFGLDYLLTRARQPRLASLGPLAATGLLLLALPSCVQPARDQRVVYLVDVSGHGPVRQVGLRGRDKPLSWERDLVLTPVVPGRLYTATVVTRTGYRATEVKFTLNGEYELTGQDNRRVPFGPGDSTRYQAVFNRRP